MLWRSIVFLLIKVMMDAAIKQKKNNEGRNVRFKAKKWCLLRFFFFFFSLIRNQSSLSVPSRVFFLASAKRNVPIKIGSADAFERGESFALQEREEEAKWQKAKQNTTPCQVK